MNVFLPVSEAERIAAALRAIAFEPEAPVETMTPAAGFRFRRAGEPAPVDVFPALDASYDEIRRRTCRFPFGPRRRRLPFLSPEDLALFKLSFGRAKDWVDLRNLAAACPTLDVDYVERQLIGLRGPTMYPRLARLRALLRPPG